MFTFCEATFGSWGQWSECTASCGSGTRTREQQCEGSDAAECTGEPGKEEENCNTGGCRKLAIVN